MKRYALLVGVNKYRDPQITSLRFAEHDATELARLLESKCGFETRCLLGNSATRENIMDVLERGRLDKDRPEISPEDIFLLFFAGHGQRIFEGGYVLYPHDGEAGMISKSLPMRDMMQLLSHRVPAERCACILDACRNLTAPGVRGAAGFDSQSSRDIKAAVDHEPGKKLVAVLFGCQEGQVSREDDNFGHGVLTYHLKQVLEEAREDVGLTFSDLADHTGDLMSRSRAGQEPQFYRPTTRRRIVLLEASAHQGLSGMTEEELGWIRLDIDECGREAWAGIEGESTDTL